MQQERIQNSSQEGKRKEMIPYFVVNLTVMAQGKFQIKYKIFKMASEIVQYWISNEVSLSKQITSFEADFSSGLLFGEILVFYGQLDDLSMFSKKTNKEGKITNFKIVEQILRALKIKFDAKLINQIMNEERGAALRLLYQVKLAIQKANGEQTSSLKTMTNLKPQVVDTKITQAEQLKMTLSMGSQFKTMNKSKKLEPVEKKLLKFEHTKKLLEDKAWADQKAEEELIRSLFQQTRQKSLNTLAENQQYMKEWEAEGKKNWQQNQTNRANAIAKVQFFEDKEVTDYKNKLNKLLDEATVEMQGGVSDFQKNLQKLGIEANTNIEDAMKRMEEKKGIPPGQIQNFSYAATMNKIKENKNVNDFAGKERDRRRRKLVVDQAKTQTDLDRKKNEEALIQKFLAKQAEEQQFAYLERRNNECKQIVIQNRSKKAEAHSVKKEEQQVELERIRNQEHEQVIEHHKRQIFEQKKYYQKVRREEKMKKRSVNIEICSEVIDLILDVANEAFESTSQRKNKKLEKAEWRDWMQIFKSGKLVSRAINGNLDLAQQLVDEDQGDYEVLTDYKKSLNEVLDSMKYEEAYEDMLDFLSVCGNFKLNVSSASTGEWGSWADQASREKIDIDFQFLNSIVPQHNPELGRSLNALLADLWKEDQTSIAAAAPKVEEGIPHYLPLKLCMLGYPFAGKRTVSKAISDQFGGKVKIFKMDDLIKEAIDYVSPKIIQEQAVDKNAKKAPPPKGKAAEDAAPIDQFAGQDTTAYKAIGSTLKKSLGETDITQAKDLVSLISDESLLVKLFIQKLKLTFPKEKSPNELAEEMRTQIQREEELIAQLKEIESTKVEVPDKSKKGPAPKKAGGASSEDQIKAELDLITKVQPEGWILLDFPRTLTQAMAFEENMTGFKCQLYQDKSDIQSTAERWQKLISPASVFDETYNGEAFIYKSAMDGLLVLNTDQGECKRRSVNKKIDPQTGTIYHMEDSPPPEGDAKLKDRLQDYTDPEADPNKLNIGFYNYDSRTPAILNWAGSFGLKDTEVKSDPVSLLMQVQVPQKEKKEAVMEQVNASITKVIAFKQAQLEFKKSQIREQIQKEAEAPPIIDQQVVEEQKVEVGVEEGQQVLNTDENQLSVDRQAFTPRSIRSKMSELPSIHHQDLSLNNQQKKDLWLQFEQSYYREQLMVFKSVRRQRILVMEGLDDIQQKYMSFLERDDNKQAKVTDFIDSFNKFSEEFPDLRADQQTKDELLNRVNQLSLDLWSIIESRKDEAVAEQRRIMENGWIEIEMRKLIKYSCKLIQSEIDKYQTVFAVTGGQEIGDSLNIESLFNKLVDEGVLPLQGQSSPIWDRIYLQILRYIQNIKVHPLLNGLDETQRLMLNTECANMMFRLNMIRSWSSYKLKEFKGFSDQVFSSLDDWLVVAVKKENEAVNQVISVLNAAVQDEVLSIDHSSGRVGELILYGSLEMAKYSEIPQHRLLEHIDFPPINLLDIRFKVAQLDHIYKQFRFHSFEEYLDTSTFIHLIMLTMQEDRTPMRWRYLDFSFFNRVAQTYQITPKGFEQALFQQKDTDEIQRTFVNWKKVFIHLLLVFSGIIYDESLIEQMREKANSSEEVSLEDFLQISFWFDTVEQMPEVKVELAPDYDDYDEDMLSVDNDRLKRVKTLLYMTLQQNTGTLRVQDFQDMFSEFRDSLSESGFEELEQNQQRIFD